MCSPALTACTANMIVRRLAMDVTRLMSLRRCRLQEAIRFLSFVLFLAGFEGHKSFETQHTVFTAF